MTPPIDELLADYAKAQPRRASGGLYALAGFRFQLALYVAELAEALSGDGDTLKTAGEVFVEALSDLATRRDDSLVCIQAKRTLTRQTLKDAAAEALAIDRFLADRHPALRPQVRFEVVAAQGDDTLDWSDLPAADLAPLAPLQQAGRLLPPRIEPDPMWRAIVAVWNRLDDPFGFIRFALDRALSRGLSPTDAGQVRADICERYTQGRRGNGLPGELLTPDQFTPIDHPSLRLEVGRAVTLSRVRDAQYMPRPGRRDELAAKLVERHDLAHRDLQSAARVFWISGRSGVGKSVLMVQVMERLVREGRRVLWLGSRAEALEPALRGLAKQDEGLWPEFIAIDDLYDRSARTRLDLASLGDFIDAEEPRPWPVILTCGPVEFADAFQEESRYRGFELHRETVHPVAADESHRLADWYRGRTGREPVVGPAFAQAGEGDGLFISLAMELEHGRLEEFAQRFADRIRLNHLDDALRLPLALNRLYLVAPYEWLSDEARERLATLNQEGDFSLDPGEPGQIVRLTHPHLGDALYKALRKPDDNPTAFAHDLARAFRHALEEGRQALADQMLRVFGARREGPAGERLAGVDDAALAQRCADAWLEHRERVAPDPETAARIAASWACWATAQPRVAALLGDDLLAQAVSLLQDSVKVWPFEWQLLWRHFPAEPRLLDWATTHLPEESRFRHPAWSFVWETAHQADPAQPQWRELGLRWLARAMRRPDWHFVWKRLLPQPPVAIWNREPVLLLGERRLTAGSDGPDWAYVLEGLLEIADGHPEQARRLVAQGLEWLPGREERAEWAYVWQALLEQADHLPAEVPLPQLLALGWGWLPGREERAEWSYIWQALLAQAEHLPEEVPLPQLLALGWGWLPGRDERAEWSYVWRTLLAQAYHLPAEVSLPQLLALGWAWLPRREERAEWAHVWEVLLAQADHLPAEVPVPQLLALGWGWLPGREERAEWAHVWRALLAQADHLPAEVSLPQLLALGWGWLPGREERAEWNYIWQALLAQADHLPAEIPLPQLLALGWGWLPGREERAEWTHVWELLLKRAKQLPASVPLAELLALGRRWLSNHQERSDWSFVWQAVYQHTSSVANQDRITLFESAWRWIQEHPTATDWPILWWELAHAEALPVPQRLELIASGTQWLSDHRHFAAREASRFVEGLLDLDARGTDSLDLAGKWLRLNVVEKFWPVIAAKFIRAFPADPVAGMLAEELSRRVRNCPNGPHIRRIASILESPQDQTEALPPAVEALRTELAERATAPAWAAARALQTSGDPVQGKVQAIARSQCFLELEIGLMTVLQITPSFQPRVGRSVSAKIIQVNPEKGTISVHLYDPAARPTHEAFPVGAVVTGRVSGIQTYGVFVRIGEHAGLIHNSKLADPEAFRAKYPVGAAIRVRVVRHKANGLELEPAEALASRIVDTPQPATIEVGGEYAGIVSGVKPFGLLVRLGNRVGLIHRNTLPPGFNFKALYPVGSRIQVQVESIEGDRTGLRLAGSEPDQAPSPSNQE